MKFGSSDDFTVWLFQLFKFDPVTAEKCEHSTSRRIVRIWRGKLEKENSTGRNAYATFKGFERRMEYDLAIAELSGRFLIRFS